MRQTSHARTVAFAGPILAAAAALAGCSDLVRASNLAPAVVNVESPAAGAVLAAQSRATPYPSFRDVPPKVTDVPANGAYAQAVARLNAERADFRAWEAANPIETSDTEGFATTARSGVTRAGQAAPPADQADQSAAWAKRARDAAKAPVSAPAQKP